MIKATIRIPTVQFGYIEFVAEGTPNEIVEMHNRMVKCFEVTKGDIQKLKDDNF